MYKLDKRLLEKIHKYFYECRLIADTLTDNPESGGNEVNSVRLITEFLKKHDYEIESPYLNVNNSFLAKKRGLCKKDKAVIMCEYDALPGIGHACGHSVSCGSSLLAGLAINEAYPDLPFQIDIMGTPSEEYHGGKILIANEGGFSQYKFAIIIHMYHQNTPSFNVLACTDRKITFNGKSTHASNTPTEGINALNAARIFMDSLDMWRQHLPKYSQIHGIIKEGGVAPNIVPDSVVLDYYFRAKTMRDLDNLVEIAYECAEGASRCTRTTFDFVQQYPTYGDLYFNELSELILKKIFEANNLKVDYIKEPQASTDAGNVDQIIPTFHPTVDATGGKFIPLHHKDFEEAMRTEYAYIGMKNGAIVIASLIERLVNEDGLFNEINKLHQMYRGKS